MAKAKMKRFYLIPILSKALDVLELLEQSNNAFSLEEVYQQTRISKTSVYRILKTLVHRGYVAQTQDGRYRLVSRPRRLRFGFAMQSGDLPFSQAVYKSVLQAAASAGVDILELDNRFDSEMAVRNAEAFVAQRVDLVLEFQVEEAVAPQVAHILKKAEIPLVAIDVPHPSATYFGVDNFECGYEAGAMLAQHALGKWEKLPDAVLGIGFAEAGSFVQSRISGAFEAIRSGLEALQPEQFFQIDGRGMREASRLAALEFFARRPEDENILVAAATDSSALGVLDAARQSGRASRVAIAGQDCIPEALDEMRACPEVFIGSVSHEAETYGPRLIQLGIALLRGYAVPPYHYVRHKTVTAESLLAKAAEK